jgi:hypothetical protein
MANFKAVHLVDDNTFLVELPWGVEAEVDGITVSGRQCVVQSLDRVLIVTRKPGELLNYRDPDGVTISADEYNAVRAALLEGCVHDEDGDRTFPSLDAEFEYRKFEARWQRGDRAPDTVTKLPAEAEVTEVRVNSGDPDIVSLWNAPHVVRDAAMYSFDRDRFMVALCKALCSEAGLSLDNRNTLFCNEEKDDLRFAKIEGGYAFDDSFNKSRQAFIGTLEQCKAEKAKCRARVENIVNVHAAKKHGNRLANAGTVLLSLRSLSNRLSGVRAKADYVGNLNGVRKELAELIASVEASLSA